jgi:hypothetical protein
VKRNFEKQIEHFVNKANKLGLSEPVPNSQIEHFAKKSKQLLDGNYPKLDSVTHTNTKLNYSHPSQIFANNPVVQEALRTHYNLN